MTHKTITSVRIIFASFALTLLAYAGLDAALTPANATVGLSACGDAANPCMLAPLTVTARNSAAHLVQVQAEPAESAVLAES
ncbi:MAG TPA: hypothetical protein VFR81_11190 [Longimicrobium sp.]|nr:hypothetical protein [Longimicrobium sp.]